MHDRIISTLDGLRDRTFSSGEVCRHSINYGADGEPMHEHAMTWTSAIVMNCAVDTGAVSMHGKRPVFEHGRPGSLKS